MTPSDAVAGHAGIVQVRHRRICRKPELVPLSGAAAAAGLLAGMPLTGTDIASGVDSASLHSEEELPLGPLPQHVVEGLLLERYSDKYTRLGLPHRMPGRQQWLKMQAAAAAARAARSSNAVREIDGDTSLEVGGGEVLGQREGEDGALAAVAADPSVTTQ